MSEHVLLIFLIAMALLYDFVNGFHDAANAIATTVTTRALSPRAAIILARTLNFVGGLLNTAVAFTIGKGVVDSQLVTLPILLAAVTGAVLWGYFTWYYGLPSSSTHALIGGLAGVALYEYNFNTSILIESGIRKVLVFMVISPICGIIIGMMLLSLLSWIVWKLPYFRTSVIFKRVQILSAAFVALSHGMNDAQNAMGVIAIGLLSAGMISEFHIPLWVRITSAFMIGLGTSVGGWRIIKTMGTKMTHLQEPIDGCAAEAASGSVILVSSLMGAPISTTQAVTGSIMGTAMAYRIGNVNWRVVKNILLAWVFTFPGAACFGIGTYLILKLIV